MVLRLCHVYVGGPVVYFVLTQFLFPFIQRVYFASGDQDGDWFAAGKKLGFIEEF
jgi:hypothetical protein